MPTEADLRRDIARLNELHEQAEAECRVVRAENVRLLDRIEQLERQLGRKPALREYSYSSDREDHALLLRGALPLDVKV